MCSLHLTHPSGAVGSRHCGARGAVGVRCLAQGSWTLPARAGIRTHNLGLPRVSSPTLYPLDSLIDSRACVSDGDHLSVALSQRLQETSPIIFIMFLIKPRDLEMPDLE